MIINVRKCAVMSSSLSLNVIKFPYKIDDEVLDRVTVNKCLGSYFDLPNSSKTSEA